MRIAHFGTFDVDNYGDLLFPHVAEWRWPDADWVHVSPTANAPTFGGIKTSIGAASVGAQPFDAIVVGGGNIVNLGKTRLAEYQGVARVAYPGLWLGSYVLAASLGVPYLVNGPSVSHDPALWVERIALGAVVRRSAYAAFRDDHSVDVAGDGHLVPDTAFDVARMWPSDEVPGDDGCLGIHLNARYVSSAEAAADAVDRLAVRGRRRVKLFPIGPCHGDVELAQRVAALMNEPVEVVAPSSVRAMALAIASCQSYVGSSMHGFITALAYGRTAALVLGDKPMQKFLGVLTATGLPASAIHRSWADAAAAPTVGFRMTEDSAQAIRIALDRHWSRVRAAAESGLRAERVPLLGAWRAGARIAQAEHLVHRLGARIGRWRSAP